MLASHSRISIPPETWYLIPLLEQLPSDRPLTPAETERAAKIMTTGYRWPDMGISESEFRARLAGLQRPTLRQVIEIVYQEHVQHEGKSRWGDKTPGYIKIAPALAALYPDARFIHLFRDGRDVAKSFQTVGWYGPWLHVNAQEWNAAIDCNERLSRTGLGTRFLQLRYEDLVLAPEETLRKVCNFLGEEFEPQMLEWKGRLDRMIPEREAKIHKKLSRKPEASDAYRWKREMSTGQLLVAEAFMGKRLSRLGYERKYSGVLWRPVLAATAVLFRFALPVVAFQWRVVRFAWRQITQQPAKVNARTR
jgi:hypothetical protein